MVSVLVRDAHVVANHLRDDEVQELLREFRVQAGFLRHGTQASDLRLFTAGVAGGQVMLSLQDAHALSCLKTLREDVHQRRIKVVDGAAHGEELLVNLRRDFITHGGGVGVKFAGRVFGSHRSLLSSVVVFCALRSSRLLRQQLGIAGCAASRRG